MGVALGKPAPAALVPQDAHFHRDCACARFHGSCLQESTALIPMVAGDGLTIKQLSTGARQNCWFCSIVLCGIKAHVKRLGYDSVMHEPKAWVEFRNRSGLKVILHPSSQKAIATDLYILPHNILESNDCKLFTATHLLPMLTDSTRTANFVRARLQDCLENHTCQSILPVELPSRLIYISRASAVPTLQLVKSDSSHRYVALSHSWGGNLSVATTNANEQNHFKEVRYADLPQSFKDAVEITLFLNLSYLWIDSLCILQDDMEDFRIEAAKMGSIYSNSLLVLSADHAKNGSEGCFNTGRVERLQLEDCMMWRENLASNGQEMRVFARPSLKHHGLHDTILREDLWDAPLSKRAWCFQERTLATRIVHYGAEEVIWECSMNLQCQCGNVDRLRYTHKQQIERLKQDVDCSKEKKLQLWNDIVVEYSSRNLTRQYDILPAISGLAKLFLTGYYLSEQSDKCKPSAFEEADLGTYLAGIWSHNLAYQLAWIPYDGKYPRAKRSSVKGIPSWSWASLRHGTAFRSPTDIRVDILRTECVLAGKDPTGPINSASIIIQGYLESFEVVLESGGVIDDGTYEPYFRQWNILAPNGEKLEAAYIDQTSIMQEAQSAKKVFVDCLLLSSTFLILLFPVQDGHSLRSFRRVGHRERIPSYGDFEDLGLLFSRLDSKKKIVRLV